MSKQPKKTPYEVVSGIPFPEKPVETRGRPSQYRFAEMKVGDSFLIPDAIQAQKVRQSVNVRNRSHRLAGEPNMFKVGQDKNGEWRCWRVS